MSELSGVNPEDWEWLKESCAELDGSGLAAARERCRRERPDLLPMLERMIAEFEEGGETDALSWLRPAGEGGIAAALLEGEYEGHSPVRMFEPGEVISDRYTVQSYVGGGGMGEVYEVADQHLPERGRLALKTIRGDLAGSREAAVRFEREIRNALHVAHPNVCRIFDLGLHRDTVPTANRRPGSRILYLTMEFLPGQTLGHWLRARDVKHNPVPEAEALPLIRQMAAGLAAIHERRIIHRDFKPGNVMLAEAGAGAGPRVVITDFGLSRLNADEMETVTQSGAAAGTPAYMAPEQLAAEGPVTSSVDVYALGVTMHEMLAGRRYRAGEPLTALTAAGVSAWLTGIIRQCLERETAKRFRDAGELVRALDHGPVELPVPFWKRWEVAAAGALAAGVVLIAALYGSAGGPPKADARLLGQATESLLNNSWYEASRALEKAVAKAPGDSFAHALLAEADDSLELSGRANREMIRAISEDGLRHASADERLFIEAVRLKMARDFNGAADAMRHYYNNAGQAARPGRAILLGRALEAAGRPAEAEGAYRSALPLAAAYEAMGALDAKQKHVDVAREEFDAARRSFAAAGEKSAFTGLDLAVGAALSSWGKPQEALDAIGRCVRDARVQGDAYGELRCRQVMGVVQAGLAKTAEDFASLEDQLAANAADAEQQGFESTAARSEMQLGQVLGFQGRHVEAEGHFKEARRLAVLAESPRLEAQADYYSADGHNRSGQPQEAEKEARRAMAFFTADRFQSEVVASALELGRALRNLGRYDEALDVLTGQTKSPGLDARQNARLRHAIATIYQYGENSPSALEALTPVLAGGVVGDDLPYLLLEAEIRADLGDLDRARQALGEIARRKGLLGPEQAELLRLQSVVEVYGGAPAKTLGRLNGTPDAESQALLGTAEVRAGRAVEGYATCEAALPRLPRGTTYSEGRLCMLEALVARRDAAGAARLYGSIGGAWTPRVESAWRAAALMASLNPSEPEARRKATEGLDTLRRAWGEAAYRRYLTRPDVQHLLASAGIR